MSNPAPMTPDTLATIRAASSLHQASEIAEMLGWDLPRLRRVAREHSIELINPEPTVPAQPAPVSQPRPPEAYEAKLQAPDDEQLERLAKMMTPKLERILRVLYAARTSYNFLQGHAIATRAGLMDPSVSAEIRAINGRLAKLSDWHVAARKGPDGGYRLVFHSHRSREPATMTA
jgi:hypothetical protein